MKRTYVLCILDGFGLGPEGPCNSISQAFLPNWSTFWAQFPHTSLDACGEAVGLPHGQMGNSEVGHMTLGAGRAIYQDLPRIDKALKEPETWHHPALKAALEAEGDIHLVGLVSEGGVHSHLSHVQAYAEFFQNQGKKVWLHAFLDGRDCPPKSALTYLNKISHIPLGTLSGRFYGMDRDHRWERTQRAYNALMRGESDAVFSSYHDYIQNCYSQDITDEFIPPAPHENYIGVSEKDVLFFFNFRADRVRQLLEACISPHFSGFSRLKGPHPAAIGMVDYGDALRPYYHILYPSQTISHTLGDVLAHQGLHQLRLAETEKYAHVTFFFNGGREDHFDHEARILIPSPKVKTYDLCPGMAAHEVTQAALSAIENKDTDFIVMNYANPDMVGHTGNLKAAIQALEVLDGCLKNLWQALQKKNGLLILTADHGNCEEMQDHKGHPHTAHTLNPVPFILMDSQKRDYLLREKGTLADVAPTLLQLMNVGIPSVMTGKSLIKANGE